MHTSAHWNEELSPGQSLDILRDLAATHLPYTGSHRPALQRLLERGDFAGICAYKLNYLEPGLTAHTVMHVRQLLAYFTKLKHLDIGVNREKLAIDKFLAAEARCKETNEIFRQYRLGLFKFEKDIDAVISTARRKFQTVLGPCPTLDKLDYRFGPGATRGVKKSEACSLAKLQEVLQCSGSLLPYVTRILDELPALAESHISEQTLEWGGNVMEVETSWVIQIVDSKVTFQPKSATALRAACTEAGLNVLAQLGLGDFMAKRLAKHGIDIKDRTKNQRLALLGSMEADSPQMRKATVDLVSASDMQALELVAEMAAPDWFSLIRAFRSHTTILPDGSICEQEKCSSMGNGFTFPLETLVFWSLAASCCEADDQVSVYGDDIIVPQYAIPLLYRVLNAVGFEVNRDKSYHDGPFRESCGADYFNGINVRPFYHKEWVSARSLFVLHNSFMRAGDVERAGVVRGFIHPTLVSFGPDGFGDGHLIGDHPRKMSDKHRSRGYGGYTFATFALKPIKLWSFLPGDFTFPSYVAYRRNASSKGLLVPLLPTSRRLYGRSESPSWSASGGILTNWNSPEVGDGHRSVTLSTVIGDCELIEHTVPGTEDEYRRVEIYTLG